MVLNINGKDYTIPEASPKKYSADEKAWSGANSSADGDKKGLRYQ